MPRKKVSAPTQDLKNLTSNKVALWVVEGMLEDKYGCGFARMIVVSPNETSIPDVHLAIKSLYVEGVTWTQVDVIRLLKIVEGRYRPASLKIPNMFELLFDEVKGRAYRRLAGKWEGWKMKYEDEEITGESKPV